MDDWMNRVRMNRWLKVYINLVFFGSFFITYVRANNSVFHKKTMNTDE